MTLADIHATLCDFAGADPSDSRGTQARMHPPFGVMTGGYRRTRTHYR